MIKQIIVIINLLILIIPGISQKDNNIAYKFDTVKTIFTTEVKDQNKSGTCWSFATVSFFESEIYKITQQEVDLSEMFFVRMAYEEKAHDYVRKHGHFNFSQGGQSHDVTNILDKYGCVPEKYYPGLNYGEENHRHSEMVAMLKAMLKSLVKNYNGKLSEAWDEAVSSVLTVYLGKNPTVFQLNNERFTPGNYLKSLGINTDDYIEITSFNHIPFYEYKVLKIPDNWSNDKYFNVKLEDLTAIMHNAINNGYTVCWDGDVSEKTFSHKNGIAILPKEEVKFLDSDYFEEIHEEKEVDQKSRQKLYDNYTTTDDHLMHITGIVKDQNDKKYFIVKNSWGEESNDLGGFLYMSEKYFKAKTIAIMLNKKGLTKDIQKKID